jgi:hypothetical protein
MLPTITTTHAVPKYLPPTHQGSAGSVRFCNKCLRAIDPAEKGIRRGKGRLTHRCEDRAAATRPSVSIPFN